MARKSKLTSAEVEAYNARCNELLSAALAYASKGYYVIPLHEPLFNDAGECTGCTCEQWKRSEQHHQWLINKGLGNKFDPNYTCPERSRGKHARTAIVTGKKKPATTRSRSGNGGTSGRRRT